MEENKPVSPEVSNDSAANLAMSEKKGIMQFEKLFLPVAILIGAVMVSGTLLYTKTGLPGGDDSGEPVKVDVSEDGDPSIGSKDAKVVIIEFSDFQCPFCRKFWKESYNVLKQDYIDTGKVRLVYRDFPLQFHPAAMPSAQATNCAHEQGKFWEYHDKIYLEQSKKGEGTIEYGVVELKKWAREIGLDTAKFNQCLDSGKYKEEVDKDFADGSAAGVSGTPSFFINGTLIVGAQPYSAFKEAIEKALDEEKSLW